MTIATGQPASRGGGLERASSDLSHRTSGESYHASGEAPHDSGGAESSPGGDPVPRRSFLEIISSPRKESSSGVQSTLKRCPALHVQDAYLIAVRV